MLVLSRRVDEGLVLAYVDSNGEKKEIEIKIIDIRCNKVKIGIDAEEGVLILRNELIGNESVVNHLKKIKKKRAAVGSLFYKS